MEDLPKEERNRRVQEALRGHFRPEFLNRIDETIIFDRLDSSQITHIVDIQLRRLWRASPSKTSRSRSTIPPSFSLARRATIRLTARALSSVSSNAKSSTRSASKSSTDTSAEGDHIEAKEKDGCLAFTKASR
jgi:ATP-dependent Clp protease ATP-binding subunit ClpB